MNNPQGPQISLRKETKTKISDEEGNVVLEIGLEEYTIRHSDKSLTHRRLNESICLVCGTIWHPGMMSEKIYVGICSQCRKPKLFSRKSHGIVALHQARHCVKCGKTLCPAHRHLSQIDQKWRCLRHHKTHHRMHILKTLAHLIFFDHKGT